MIHGLTLLLLVPMACEHAEEPLPPRPPLEERLDFERPAPAEKIPVATLPAEVVPAPGALQLLGPGVEGRITSWLVTPGSTVVAGDPLAELRSPALSALEARRQEAKTHLEQAEDRVTLLRAASEKGVASAIELQGAIRDRAEAEAALRAVTRELRALGDTTTRGERGWIWRAPTAGVVGALRCPTGQVSADALCLELVQPEGVVLEVAVPERLLGLLHAPVEASYDAADGTTWPFAEISRAPHLDPRTRTRSFRFGVVGDRAPLPGSAGRVQLRVPADPDTWIVPAAALTRIDGEPVLFVRTEGDPEPRSVSVLGRDAERIWVRGLGGNEDVVTRGVFLLKSLTLLEEG